MEREIVRVRAALAAITSAFVVGVLPGTANAFLPSRPLIDPVALKVQDHEVMLRQRGITDAAGIVQAAIDKDGSGFAGLQIDVNANEISVYWQNIVPDSVQDAIEAARKSVHVRVLASPYSRAELRMESRRLVGSEQQGGRVVQASPLLNGTGIRVRVQPTKGASASAPALAVQSRFPVVIEPGPGPTPTSRWADSAPFWGGALVERNDEPGFVGHCTTGFAGTRSGVSVVVTAAHCRRAGTPAWRTPQGTLIPPIGVGNEVAVDFEKEALYIGAQSSNSIYDGGVDGSGAGAGEFGKRVTGRATTRIAVGTSVCLSGGYSGTICGIRVTDNDVFYVLGGAIVTNGVEAQRDDHTQAVQTGDSGGSMFTLAADPANVIAQGVQSAGDSTTQVACTRGLIRGTCFWRILFAAIDDMPGFTVRTS